MGVVPLDGVLGQTSVDSILLLMTILRPSGVQPSFPLSHAHIRESTAAGPDVSESDRSLCIKLEENYKPQNQYCLQARGGR